MAPRRVAYLIWSLARGGAERQLVELVRGLDRARYVPTVIVRRTQNAQALPLDAPLVSLDIADEWTAAGFARLVRTLRGLRPDLLHTVMDPENLHGRLAARAAGVSAVLGSVRCPVLPAATRLSERLTQRLVRGTVVNSVGIREALRRDAGVDPARVTVIENGVDTARFAPPSATERAAQRARWCTPDARLWVLPGRISKEKNQRWFLEALAGAPKDRETVALLPGADGLDASYVRAVRDAARESSARVLLPGPAEDMAAVLGAADAVWVPSDYEGLSNVVIEAMSCGALVCVSDGANADAVVTDGVDGISLGPASPHGLSAAMARVCALPDASRAALASRARETAVTRFALDVMVRRTMDLYDRIL